METWRSQSDLIGWVALKLARPSTRKNTLDVPLTPALSQTPPCLELSLSP